MAGYIFNLTKGKNEEETLRNIGNIIFNGVYSTIMNIPEKQWKTAHEGTFGDYITMQAGDNVYFFTDRKIYGIGKLINIKGDCKFLNFPNADKPDSYISDKFHDGIILNALDTRLQNRMLCVFQGAPFFFKHGVDMDDVLSSNPEKFKMLRAFERLSFIKIDDEENQALIDVILKNNEQNLSTKSHIFETNGEMHRRIESLIDQKYEVNADKILSLCADNTLIKHEMALEAGILDSIINQKTNTFGHWDFLTHQITASPFKPIIYMDKMDVFGYRYIPGFNTISKYLVIEVKKGKVGSEAINQVMKYVDWINQEYSHNDYHMIEAFIVAYDYSDDVLEYKEHHAKRNFVKGGRNATSQLWDNLTLIKYKFDNITNQLIFSKHEYDNNADSHNL